MCTVTVVPRVCLAGAVAADTTPLLRVVCSRDEQRSRAEAKPPERRRIGDHDVAMPIDPAGGGTWIAVNNAGLVLTLLNRYTAERHERRADDAGARGHESRGLVIPMVGGCRSSLEAFHRLSSVSLARFPPFRLILVDPVHFIECWPEQGRLRHRRMFLRTPVMRTSSSLGDARVTGPRGLLFRRFVTGARNLAAAQDGFHAHQWPGHEDVSVRMARPDACTVSVTTIEVRPHVATVRYEATATSDAHRVAVRVREAPGAWRYCA